MSEENVAQEVAPNSQDPILFTFLGDIRAEENVAEVIDDGRAKIAEIDTDCCMAWDGGSCQFCYLACPLRDRAITIEDQKPIINSSICDGCAKCLTACKTVNTNLAIKMVAMN